MKRLVLAVAALSLGACATIGENAETACERAGRAVGIAEGFYAAAEGVRLASVALGHVPAIETATKAAEVAYRGLEAARVAEVVACSM
jgi:hypothetical protein